MSLESEIRNENRKVAYYLLNYPDIKKELEEQRLLILNATHHPDDPAPGRNTPKEPGDPTGAVVVQLSELHERERWVQLCEDVANGLPWKKQIILQLRQEMRGASRRTGDGGLTCSGGIPSWWPRSSRSPLLMYTSSARLHSASGGSRLWSMRRDSPRNAGS